MTSDSRKILIFRLSALGDVVLATSYLSALKEKLPANQKIEIHWVVKARYAPILRGHPSIHRVIAFDDQGSLFSWVQLIRSLVRENYDDWIDLHRSLRTRLAFAIAQISGVRATFKSVRKERLKTWAYFTFKGLWPVALRPRPFYRRFAEVAEKKSRSTPSLPHLTNLPWPAELPKPTRENWAAIVPASRWIGKEWPTDRWVAWIRRYQVYPVILGLKTDRACTELVEKLTQQSIPHTAALGLSSIQSTVAVLSHAPQIYSVDSGLAHVAEAIGRPVHVLFGPTAPDGGFGPWRENSQVIQAKLWCRPCSKDGTACFRVTRRYLCMSLIDQEKQNGKT